LIPNENKNRGLMLMTPIINRAWIQQAVFVRTIFLPDSPDGPAMAFLTDGFFVVDCEIC
jgi:hypothetical protein